MDCNFLIKTFEDKLRLLQIAKQYVDGGCTMYLDKVNLWLNKEIEFINKRITDLKSLQEPNLKQDVRTDKSKRATFIEWYWKKQRYCVCREPELELCIACKEANQFVRCPCHAEFMEYVKNA